MNSFKKVLLSHQRTLYALLAVFLFSATVTFAVPPASPYTPGATLDPNCAPGSTNCTVGVPQWVVSGSDASYTIGNIGIGTTAPAARLEARGATADNTASALRVSNSANDSLLSVRNDGRVIVGSATPLFNGSAFILTGMASHVIERYASVPSFFAYRINGTADIPTNVVSGNQLLTLEGRGYNGSGLSTGGGSFKVVADGAFSTISNPTKLELRTTPVNGTSDVRRMVIGSDGNIGIGMINDNTATPLYRLDARDIVTARTANFRIISTSNGTATYDTTAGALLSYGGYFNSSATRSAGANALTNVAVYASATGGQNNYAAIFAAGLVGIGNSTPIYLLHAGSSSQVGIVARFENSTGTCDINPTATALSCSSDMTLKKNIASVENGTAWSFSNNIALGNQTTLSKLLALIPVTYNWNAESDGTAKHAGFIAQEARQLFPDLVTEDPSTHLLSLNYMGLIPYTVQAIKEIDLNITDISNLDRPNTWRESLVAWLGSASNGITTIFSKKVSTDQLCVGTACVTQQEFMEMIQHRNGSPSAIIVMPPANNNETEPVPGEGVTPEEEPAPEVIEPSEEAPATPPAETPAEESAE